MRVSVVYIVERQDEVEVSEETAFLIWGLIGTNQAAEIFDCVGDE